MNPIFSILLLALITGVGGLTFGGLLALLFRRESPHAISLLVSFTVGIMLSVACFHMIPEAIEHSEGLLLPVGCLLGGFAVTWVLDHWMGHGGHGHGHGHDHDLNTAGAVLAMAVALHNMPVGMAVGATIAASQLTRATIMTAGVLALHNIPEGMSIAAPLLGSGATPRRAVAVAAASGLPTILGAYLGFYLGSAAPLLLVVSLALAAGAMLYVIFLELLPEALAHRKGPWTFLLIGLGLALGALILRLGGHTH